MKFALYLSAFSLVGNTAFAALVECYDLVTADIKIVTKFDSNLPILESTITRRKLDGSVGSESKKNYLSPVQACSASVAFSSDCKSSERQDSLGYDFQFTCAKVNISGNLYVDESGQGQFTCNEETPVQFFNCAVNQH
jgi:hypothetical protein